MRVPIANHHSSFWHSHVKSAKRLIRSFRNAVGRQAAAAYPEAVWRQLKRANPAVPWRLVAIGFGLIAATVAAAVVAVAVAASPRAPSRPVARRSAMTAASPDATCPASDTTRLRSTRPGAEGQLVPPDVRAVLLCRYNGLPEPGSIQPGFGLVAEHRVRRRSQAAQLAAELDALPAPAPGATACPADTGSAIVAYFSYASVPGDPVTIGLNGCQTASNGRLTRFGDGRPVIEQLAALTPISRAFVLAHEAEIQGRVRQCGGPAPGICRPAGSTAGDEIKVLAGEGYAVGLLAPRRDRFTVLVPPGREIVQLVAGWRTGRPRVLAAARVRTRARRTTLVRLTLQIR